MDHKVTLRQGTPVFLVNISKLLTKNVDSIREK